MPSLFKKFIEFAIGNIVVLVLGLISTSVISRIISPSENGKYSLFVTVTTLIVLVVKIGMDQSYIRYYHDESSDNRGAFSRRCLTLPMLVNLVIGILTLLLYKPISNFIVGENSFTVVLLLVMHSTATIISNFALIHIRMKQRAKLYSLLTAITKITYLILVWATFSNFGDNYLTLIVALTISNIIVTILAVIYEKDDWFSKRSSKNIKTATKELVNYGTPFIFSMAIIWIFQSIDKISLRVFSNDIEIGLYAGAISIVGMLNTLQGAFTTFWTPVAYEKYTKNPEDKEFFIKINKIVSFLMLLISIGLIATKDIIVMLLGPKYIEAVFIFPFLVFMPIMYTISETTVLGINFNKKTKDHIYIAICSAVANIIGNIILVPKLGATGAAISTGLAYVVFFITRTYYANKYYKIEFKSKPFWISVIMTYILAAYSSVNNFNFTILILTILSIIVVIISYNDIVKELYFIIVNTIKKLKGKNM